MRQTQDIVVARLRELVRGWRVDTTPGAPDLTPAASLTSGVPPLTPHVGAEDVAPGRADPLGEDDAPGPPLDEPARTDPAGETVESGSPAGRVPTPWGRVGGLLAAVALTIAVVTAFLAWPRPVGGSHAGTGSDEAAGAASPSPGPMPAGWSAADPFAVPTPSTPSTIVVHVAGEVRRPGVVRLPGGSRVIDAVEAAGGLKRGGSVGGANLARILSDGERVEVGASVVGEAPPMSGAASGNGGAGAPATLLNLNTATAEQLDTLPGIGPVTAAKILAWRSQHGRFSVVDELAEVPGIGPKTLEELRPHVRV